MMTNAIIEREFKGLVRIIAKNITFLIYYRNSFPKHENPGLGSPGSKPGPDLLVPDLPTNVM